MTTLKTPIGILGGTFDPIHFGHLRSALELQQAFSLAEIRFIPCFQPVHRKQPDATPQQRFAMVKKAIEQEPLFTLDDCEIIRKGASYTIDTLEILKQKFLKTPLCLIMGIDALLNFSSWHRYEEILQLAHLIVMHRPQYQLPQTGIVAELLRTRLQKNHELIHTTLAGSIILHPVTSLEISATDIRKQIAAGLSPRFLLPDNVLTYLQENQVYSLSKKR